MTVDDKIAGEGRLGLPSRGGGVATIFGGRLSGPALEGAVERTLLGKAKQVGHLGAGHVPLVEILAGGAETHRVEDVVENQAFILQAALQRSGRHRQPFGDRLELRTPAAQFFFERLPDDGRIIAVSRGAMSQDAFLQLMHLSERSLEVAGGVILLMISIRMIFGSGESIYSADLEREPFVFPLAIPLLAGPSALATVLLLASRQPERMLEWVGALTCAMVVSGLVLLAANRIRRWIGESMVSAIEKLMGLVLTAVSVEMTPTCQSSPDPT